MIVATRQGNRELRMFEASALIPSPGSSMALSSSVLRAQEVGIDSVACAVQLLSETIASFNMLSYEGRGAAKQPLYDAPQTQLFDEPAEDVTSFDLWCDTIVALELERNAFLWKGNTSAGVEELYPVDPRVFEVTRPRANAPKVIKARVNGVLKDVTANVIHVRSWSPAPGSVEGVSKLELHRRTLRTALSLEEYRGRYFDNDGAPGLVLDASGSTPSLLQRQELLEDWTARHSSPENAGKPGLIWGSVKAIHQLAPNLQESQAAELDQMVALQVARIFRIYPPELIHAAVGRTARPMTAEQIGDVFFRFSLWPRMNRLARVVSADRELFPDRRRYCAFDFTDLLQGDRATMANFVHQLMQVTAINRNEGRAFLGLPPVEGGDEFLQTPVGAAPNDNQNPSSADDSGDEPA